ncbi:MAG TPA: WD40 repeat domain-containing protein [Coleofasciculaceae cyanobacterium]
MELELGLQLLVQGLPAIAQIFTSIQEERLARLKHQHAKESLLFNAKIPQAASQKSEDCRMWGFEQEKSLQQQLAIYDRETQLKLATYQRETALQLPEFQKVLNHWPLRLFPSQLLNSHRSDSVVPLRIFLTSPNGQLARLSELSQALPEIEQNLAQNLGEFLSQNYPLSSQERPTEFLAGAWDSKRSHREASIKALFERLKSEPTLILESEFVGDYLNLRIAYWGFGQTNYCYKTIISQLNYRTVVYTSAKNRALKWKAIANRLLACGESPEDVNRLGGDNEFNLEVLEKEKKWQQLGIDTNELPLEYKLKPQDFEVLTQLLTTCYSIVVAWVADAHHLVNYDVSPLLPKLLPHLLEQDSDPQLVQDVIKTTILGYKDIFQSLECERPLWVPELALKLALSLVDLPDKSWAKEQVDYSIKAWLRQHQGTQIEETNSIEVTPFTLTPNDEHYFQNLQDCMAVLEDERTMAEVTSLLRAVKDLQHQIQQDNVSIVQPEANEGIIQDSCFVVNNTVLSNPFSNNVSLIHTLTGHSGKAASIAVSFDGQMIASGSDDSSIKLWHLGTGELLHTLTGESGRVLTIALSSDGKTLASSHKTSDRSCIQVWQLGADRQLPSILRHTLPGHNKWIYSLAISPDGQTLVSGSHKIKTWHLDTGEPLRTLVGHKKWVYSLAISPDGQTFASSGGDKIVKIWHLYTGELLRTLIGHSDWVRTVTISSDGQVIATGSDDNTIKLWHLPTGKLIRTLTGHTDWVLSLAFSPDGRTLISGSRDSTIKLWHWETGKLWHTLTGHKKWVYSIAISPDGQTLASGSEDKTVKIWRTQ